MLQNYERLAGIKTIQKIKAKSSLQGQERTEAIERFRKAFGELSGPVVYNFPGWKTRYVYSRRRKAKKVQVEFIDPDANTWYCLKEIEADFQVKIERGDGGYIPGMIYEAKANVNLAEYSLGFKRAKRKGSPYVACNGTTSMEVKSATTANGTIATKKKPVIAEPREREASKRKMEDDIVSADMKKKNRKEKGTEDEKESLELHIGKASTVLDSVPDRNGKDMAEAPDARPDPGLRKARRSSRISSQNLSSLSGLSTSSSSSSSSAATAQEQERELAELRRTAAEHREQKRELAELRRTEAEHRERAAETQQKLTAALDRAARAERALEELRQEQDEDSVAYTFVADAPDVKWDDIGGLVETKRNLQEMIRLLLRHPKGQDRRGMQLSRSALFYGPPGCGKSLLAKAVARGCSRTWISVKGPELATMYRGESEANVRKCFEIARKAAPCVMFIDEFDSVGTARGSSDDGDRVIFQLLTDLESLGEHVIFIGATNSPEQLDKALLRPGRLDQLIYFPLPDLAARQGILEATLKQSSIAANVPISFLAKQTEGFSGADLAYFCKRAFQAARCDANVAKELKVAHEVMAGAEITRKHFEEAFAAARRSVDSRDLAKYDEFRRKFDPVYRNCFDGSIAMQWPDALGMGGSEDDDDLYA
eukprot:TRINITY_DN9543_c0_g2_i2.p1 TRINITY_DN9543_c0_g2~~TRINITY_DN9543_c0_g2_i2.p1  ORF type:complete len:720 (-),score=125.42 TRINITY_DN9543_c0_g2_i2:330-2291(-)